LRVHAVLVVPAEVDDPVRALMATALVPGGDAAVRISPAMAVQRSHQRLLRLRPGDLGEIGDAGTATTGRRGLVLANCHVRYLSVSSGYAGAPNRSIGLLPGARVTIARLVPLRVPNPVRVRLRLPCRLAVFTDATLTLKICSTAI